MSLLGNKRWTEVVVLTSWKYESCYREYGLLLTTDAEENKIPNTCMKWTQSEGTRCRFCSKYVF